LCLEPVAHVWVFSTEAGYAIAQGFRGHFKGVLSAIRKEVVVFTESLFMHLRRLLLIASDCLARQDPGLYCRRISVFPGLPFQSVNQLALFVRVE
jgi:hypothetical protein